MEEKYMIDIFKALSDRTRKGIFELLLERELNVTDICAEFEISQPTVSHHLHILRACQLLDSRKRGKNIYYSVRHDIVRNAFDDFSRRISVKVRHG